MADVKPWHIRHSPELGKVFQDPLPTVDEALLIAALEGAGTQVAWCQDIYAKHLSAE